MGLALYLSRVRSSDLLGGIKLFMNVFPYGRNVDEPVPPVNRAAHTVPAGFPYDKGIGLSVRDKLVD